jgi:hypothetical protein
MDVDHLEVRLAVGERFLGSERRHGRRSGSDDDTDVAHSFEVLRVMAWR